MRWRSRSAVLLTVVALSVPLVPPSGAAEQTVEPVFWSRPDLTKAPPPLTTEPSRWADDGLLLTTPITGGLVWGPGGPPDPPEEEEQPYAEGAAIYDNEGNLVWWQPGEYFNMSEVTFQGEPALSVFSRDLGAYLVLDSSYQEVGRFSMQGYPTDLHDIQFSPDGSRVLMLAYHSRTMDMSEYGGPADAQVTGAVIQEQDVATGEVTFEWNSFDHIPVTETRDPLDRRQVDYLHVSSLRYDSDGNILMSGRQTSTVYKIDSTTGDIVWRLGGDGNDFRFEDEADLPSYQHDARRLPNGNLSVFDNGNERSPQESRGAVYHLDEEAMTATLVEDLRGGDPLFAEVMGSNMTSADGNRLVSYGSTGHMVEFRDGSPVFSASLPEDYYTYRSDRSDWVATPAGPPDVAYTEPDSEGERNFHMSWNGATEVESWRISAGPSARELRPVEWVEWSGFETSAEVDVPAQADVFRISALDGRGRVLDSVTLTAGSPTGSG